MALEIGFDGEAVNSVRVQTPHLVLGAGDPDTDLRDTLAFHKVESDRLQLGLESPGVGPMTVTVDLVRTAIYSGDGGPDRDVVVAGVARVASVGTVTLVCTGW